VLIGPERIVEISVFTGHCIAWPTIVRIENTTEGIYVFDSRTSAIVILRRGFDTPAAANAFYGMARKYFAENRY